MGNGLPLGLVALAGSTWALLKLVFLRARPGEFIVWAWLVPYFGITGAFLAKFNRYMSPVLPFVLLFAACPDCVAAAIESQTQTPTGGTSAGGAAGHPCGRRRLFWSLAYTSGVYASEHTWVTASRWVYANVPTGSVIYGNRGTTHCQREFPASQVWTWVATGFEISTGLLMKRTRVKSMKFCGRDYRRRTT